MEFGINDNDKNGFMSVIHRLPKGVGLDLILHTPGGDMSATESLIDYLRQIFNNDIRAIIPQMAMSGGSMIACSCKEIIMGLHSNLGPFDPQINGTPAQAIIEEFERAKNEINNNNSMAYIWQPIIQKYNLGFITQVQHAIKMAESVVDASLRSNMFAGDPQVDAKVAQIIAELGSNRATQTHSRHIHRAKAKSIGLKVVDLEADPTLQDRVLSVHHASMITFEQAGAFKMIENHIGSGYIQSQNMVVAVA
jgi:membrane-bound ClpP family serine protease